MKLKKQYSLSWKFLKESKWYFVFSLGLFCLFFLVGFAFPIFFREQILELIAKLTDLLVGKSLLSSIFIIFLNNLRASLLAMIFGILVGIVPLAITVVNGYLLGFVSRGVVEEEGVFILWKLLPHGIFELPAVLFSVGLGLKIGASLFSRKRKTKEEFKESLRFFIFVVLPLLLIAAVIEGTLIFLSR